MSRDIWTRCAPKFKFARYKGEPWRVVEAQHVIATRKLVDSDEEQELLEEVIDDAKPLRPYDRECANYHYLLWTPFRYPPLKHGSRLGTPDRRGLWYGSEKIKTAFAEKAYYTLLFREGSRADFGVFETPVTVFNVPIATSAGVDLTRSPFKEFESDLASPVSYAASHRVGRELRDLGAEVICFKSARCPEGGLNIAVTTIAVFQKRRPQDHSSWFCVSSRNSVEFKPVGIQAEKPKRVVFRRGEFEVDGVLPRAQFSP